jgi:DNA polymerase-3 subunit alpha
VSESLIKCGAFDSTGAKRSQMMAMLEDASEVGQKIQKDRLDGQISLFDVLPEQGADVVYPPFPEIEEWDESQVLNYEKETLGFFVTGHPLARHEPVLKKFANTDTLGLLNQRDGSTVRIGGLIRDLKHYNDKKGDLMAFVTLEDLHGFVEITLFSSVYSSVSDFVKKDAAVFVEGRITKDEQSAKILADTVVPVEKAEETWTTSVNLNLDVTMMDKEKLQQLYNILHRHKGSSNAFLCLRIPERTETVIALPNHIRLRAGSALADAVNEFLGYRAVETVCGRL